MGNPGPLRHQAAPDTRRQGIFSFDGPSTDFIRSFEADYDAERFVIRYDYRNRAP